jgi:hypothetical protein
VVAGLGDKEREILAALLRLGALSYSKATAKWGSDDGDGYCWSGAARLRTALGPATQRPGLRLQPGRPACGRSTYRPRRRAAAAARKGGSWQAGAPRSNNRPYGRTMTEATPFTPTSVRRYARHRDFPEDPMPVSSVGRSTTRSASSSSSPVLRQGARGTAVKEMQNLLRKKGYNIAADGVFGPRPWPRSAPSRAPVTWRSTASSAPRPGRPCAALAARRAPPAPAAAAGPSAPPRPSSATRAGARPR